MGPSTLSLYIARKFVFAVMAVFALCALLIFMIDIVELLRQAGKGVNVSVGTIVAISLLRLPAYTELLLPFAVLVGAMGTMLLLSRKSELAVMRAGGMSVWQFLFPGLAVAFALGTFSTTVYNPMAASGREQAEQLFATAYGREANVLAAGRGGSAGNWLRQNGPDGQSVINAVSASKKGTVLQGIRAVVYDNEGHFVERVDAPNAELHQGFWELRNAVVSRVGREPERFETYLIATYLTPERVADALGSLISVSFWELGDIIQLTEKAGLSSHRWRVQYQVLLSRPLLCVAMVFLAATVSLRSFRSGGIQTMVVTGMIGGFGFFLFAEISRQVGSAGLAPALSAAWVPILLTICVTMTVLLHQEDG